MERERMKKVRYRLDSCSNFKQQVVCIGLHSFNKEKYEGLKTHIVYDDRIPKDSVDLYYMG